MNISERQIAQETAVSQTRRLDWPIIVFFGLAYLIAWGMIPLLGVCVVCVGKFPVALT